MLQCDEVRALILQRDEVSARAQNFNDLKCDQIVKYLINEKTIDKYPFKCYTIIVPRVKQESD